MKTIIIFLIIMITGCATPFEPVRHQIDSGVPTSAHFTSCLLHRKNCHLLEEPERALAVTNLNGFIIETASRLHHLKTLHSRKGNIEFSLYFTLLSYICAPNHSLADDLLATCQAELEPIKKQYHVIYIPSPSTKMKTHYQKWMDASVEP